MPFVLVVQTSIPHTIRMVNSRPGLIALLVILGLLLNNTRVSAHTHAPVDAEAHAAFHGTTFARHKLAVAGSGHQHNPGANPTAGHLPVETGGKSAARRGELDDDPVNLKVVQPVGYVFVGAMLAPIPSSRGPTLLAWQLRAFLQVFLM